MRTNGPTVFGAFLARTQETQVKLLMDSNTATQAKQQTIATFFSSVTPTHGTSQSRAAQMGSQPGHCKGVTIDQAKEICHACCLSLMDHNLITLFIDK